MGGTRTGHFWNLSRSYVQVLASLVRARGLEEGKYWGIIREYWGEMLEIGGLKIAQTGSKRTEGSGLNTPLGVCIVAPMAGTSRGIW